MYSTLPCYYSGADSYSADHAYKIVGSVELLGRHNYLGFACRYYRMLRCVGMAFYSSPARSLSLTRSKNLSSLDTTLRKLRRNLESLYAM